MGTSITVEQHRAIRSFKAAPGPLRMAPQVQHYDWGSSDFIPALLGISNPEARPFAELWMGAHPNLPAAVELDGVEVALDVLIEQAAEQVLGPLVARKFGCRLPYLFKVLAAAAPLSIQAHPGKAQAEEGFAREELEGIPRTAPQRNFKDDNHKPELIVALSDFFALRGFRPPEEIGRVLSDNPEFRGLMHGYRPDAASLKALYERFMNLPQPEVDAILRPLVRRLNEAASGKPFGPCDHEYWVLQADRQYSREGHADGGLFSIYLLNLVHLRPGDALYLPPGILHAYLRGAGMEIMANSDNVLRGGLTTKHVDVTELLRHVVFEGDAPQILGAARVAETQEWVYGTPACEFELGCLRVSRGRSCEGKLQHSADIVMLVDADENAPVTISSAGQKLALRRGEAVLIPFEVPYMIEAEEPATLYRATVPAEPAVPPPYLPPPFRGQRPAALKFGTSGLRGPVEDITDLEAYINTRGFLDYLFRLEELRQGESVCIAGDLRPSTDSPGRSIMRGVARAIEDAGLRVDNLGKIPTPALTYFAMQQGCASVMVTGSHIPFDRNGIKFNRKSGEVLKQDEPGILEAVAQVRQREYGRPAEQSLFGDDGMLKPDKRRPLPPVIGQAARAYRQRYLDFFRAGGLEGKRIVFFQHSAVGGDLLVHLLEDLGAEVHPAGRSETFIPIDTEDISEDLLRQLQRMANGIAGRHGPVDALVSTDGDSDRALLCGIAVDGGVRFFGGDLLGIVVADYLRADSISVPISANDAVDGHFAPRGIHPVKTRIGSPHVIEAMEQAKTRGGCHRIVGWEANGGFLTGSTIHRDGRTLAALPTRDAALPLLCALHSAAERGCSLVELFARLPRRFSRAGLIDAFPREASRAIVRRFSPLDLRVTDVEFEGDRVTLAGADGRREPADVETAERQWALRRELAGYFTGSAGFAEIARINTLDGVRIYFRNGDIVHVRPSGNAPQLRIYAVADEQVRADRIVRLGLLEPDGILRTMAARIR